MNPEISLYQQLIKIGNKYSDKAAILHAETKVTYRELFEMADVFSSFLYQNDWEAQGR